MTLSSPDSSRDDPRCPDRFEPWQLNDERTHTCLLAAGHVGRHHCPVCGLEWPATPEDIE